MNFQTMARILKTGGKDSKSKAPRRIKTHLGPIIYRMPQTRPPLGDYRKSSYKEGCSSVPYQPLARAKYRAPNFPLISVWPQRWQLALPWGLTAGPPQKGPNDTPGSPLDEFISQTCRFFWIINIEDAPKQFFFSKPRLCQGRCISSKA